ncbi:MAG: hypothetical protein ACKVQC_11310, partial [Elusimicrobiota bacterium]
DESPPENHEEAIKNIKMEIDSVFDFEIDAIHDDIELTKDRVSWDDKSIVQAESSFLPIVNDLKNKYNLKISGFKPKKNGNGSGHITKQPSAVPNTTHSAVNHSAGSSSSSAPVLLMFIFGLLIGSAPAVFFWTELRDLRKNMNEQKSKLVSDKRSIEGTMILMQDSFYQLASGKGKNLPNIEKELAGIEKFFTEKKKELDIFYVNEKQSLMRRTSPGLKQDQELDKLAQQKQKKLDDLKASQEIKSEELIKQRDLLKELLSR